MTRTRITHVAIRFKGVIWSLPSPYRHHDVIREICEETGAETVDSYNEQGFLDEGGNFLRRKPALAIARLFGQIKDESKVRAGMLTSEDLW